LGFVPSCTTNLHLLDTASPLHPLQCWLRHMKLRPVVDRWRRVPRRGDLLSALSKGVAGALAGGCSRNGWICTLSLRHGSGTHWQSQCLCHLQKMAALVITGRNGRCTVGRTNLDYAQCLFVPKRGEHRDRYRTDCRALAGGSTRRCFCRIGIDLPAAPSRPGILARTVKDPPDVAREAEIDVAGQRVDVDHVRGGERSADRGVGMHVLAEVRVGA
jgi:hypothetical protein